MTAPWITHMVGLIAATLSMVGLMPQVFKIMKTNDTISISFGMFVLSTGGRFLWLIYGLLKGDMAVIAANLVGLASSAFILVRKVRNEGVCL